MLTNYKIFIYIIYKYLYMNIPNNLIELTNIKNFGSNGYKHGEFNKINLMDL